MKFITAFITVLLPLLLPVTVGAQSSSNEPTPSHSHQNGMESMHHDQQHSMHMDTTGNHAHSKTEEKQQHRHGQIEPMSHDSAMHMNSRAPVRPALPRLRSLPESGKSREAGYDQRYVMEFMTQSDSLDTLCAQASRGLIMLDNAHWARCGGKPEGGSKGVDADRSASGSQSQTTGHSEHHQQMHK